MSDAKPSHVSELVVGAATGIVLGYLWIGTAAQPAPPPAALAAAGQAGILDAALQPYVNSAANQVATQIGPMILQDAAFQQHVGQAAGAEVANKLLPIGYVVAAAAVLAAGAAVYNAVSRK